MGYWNSKIKGFAPEMSEDITTTNYTDEQINAMYAQGDVITGNDGEPVVVPRTVQTEKEPSKQLYYELKAELAQIKEDIEQETFGLVRDDFAEKKERAAEIINELRVLEGKEPREIISRNLDKSLDK